MTTALVPTAVPQPTADDIKIATLKKLETDLKEYHWLKSVEDEAADKATALKPGIMAAITVSTSSRGSASQPSTRCTPTRRCRSCRPQSRCLWSRLR